MKPELHELLSYYRRQGAPSDQNALISLLREVQTLYGGSIPAYLPESLARELDTKPALINALIRRIPSLRLADKHRLELCAGPNCGKARHLAALAEELCRNRTDVELVFVPCMRLCGKGPNLRWDGQLSHKADEALLRTLLRQKS